MKLYFLGFGGHAGNLLDICELQGYEVAGYADENVHNNKYPKITELPKGANAVLGFGGIDCEFLEHRYNSHLDYEAEWPVLVHPDTTLSPHGLCGKGTQIMAGVVIQRNVSIGQFCIINTCAVIEHNAQVGDGCHIAPGAIVLGDAKVGDYCFIGANAVIVQGCSVQPHTFVKANSTWKQK